MQKRLNSAVHATAFCSVPSVPVILCFELTDFDETVCVIYFSGDSAECANGAWCGNARFANADVSSPGA